MEDFGAVMDDNEQINSYAAAAYDAIELLARSDSADFFIHPCVAKDID